MKYDNSIILKSICDIFKNDITLNCIGNSCESFKTIDFKFKKIKYSLKLLDMCNFIKGSLNDLSKNLNIPTHYNHNMQSYHHIMASLYSAMDLTILHIISFHSFPCRSHDYCFLTTSSRHLGKRKVIIIARDKDRMIVAMYR